MINAKLPRCPEDGDRGDHMFLMAMHSAKVTLRCRDCGGYLCKDEPAESFEVNDVPVHGVQRNNGKQDWVDIT